MAEALPIFHALPVLVALVLTSAPFPLNLAKLFHVRASHFQLFLTHLKFQSNRVFVAILGFLSHLYLQPVALTFNQVAPNCPSIFVEGIQAPRFWFTNLHSGILFQFEWSVAPIHSGLEKNVVIFNIFRAQGNEGSVATTAPLIQFGAVLAYFSVLIVRVVQKLASRISSVKHMVRVFVVGLVVTHVVDQPQSHFG